VRLSRRNDHVDVTSTYVVVDVVGVGDVNVVGDAVVFEKTAS
jgi:hypothetical protein